MLEFLQMNKNDRFYSDQTVFESVPKSMCYVHDFYPRRIEDRRKVTLRSHVGHKREKTRKVHNIEVVKRLSNDTFLDDTRVRKLLPRGLTKCP